MSSDNPTGTVCRHSPNCEVAQTQRDLQAQAQALSEIVGEGFERVDQRLDQALGRIEQVHGEHLESARTYIDCNDRILEMLHRVVPSEG